MAANLAASPLDFRILGEVRSRWGPEGVVYTRYADDLVVSTTDAAVAPALLVSSILAAGALSSLQVSRTWRLVGWAAANAALMVNLSQVLWVFQRYDPVSVVLGIDSEEEYLLTGQRYYPAFEWLHANSDPEDAVLVVGESRIFHLDRGVWAGSFIDPPPYRNFLSDGCDADCLAQNLRRAGIRWIYVDPEHYRVGTANPDSTDELSFFATVEEDRIFRGVMADHATLAYQAGNSMVFRLAPTG